VGGYVTHIRKALAMGCPLAQVSGPNALGMRVHVRMSVSVVVVVVVFIVVVMDMDIVLVLVVLVVLVDGGVGVVVECFLKPLVEP